MRLLRDVGIAVLGMELVLVSAVVQGTSCERLSPDVVVCRVSPLAPAASIVGVALLLLGLWLAGRRSPVFAAAVGLAALAAGASLLLLARVASEVVDCAWAAYNLSGQCETSELGRAVAEHAGMGAIVALASGFVVAVPRSWRSRYHTT